MDDVDDGDVGMPAGAIVRFDELVDIASGADGREVSVRALCTVTSLDVANARVTATTTRSRRDAKTSTSESEGEIEIDFSAVRADEHGAFEDGQIYRRGARVCVIGEARARADDGKIELRARVARAVDGLDLDAYEKLLEMRRKFLAGLETATLGP